MTDPGYDQSVKKYASHLLAQEPDIIGRLYGTTEFF